MQALIAFSRTLLVFSVWFEEIMNVTREAVAAAAGADA